MAKESRTADIDTLERLLNSESDVPMEILPDGTMKVGSGTQQKYLDTPKLLTFRQAIASGY